MKKITVVLLALVLALSVTACTGSRGTDGYELALITDSGTIDDKSFNQGSWEGLKKYAEEHDITHTYYQPAEESTSAYLDTISLAVEGGAKVIVTPGFLFEPAIFEAQDLYPDTKFIILDGEPRDENWNARIEDNVYAIYYAEEESGFLAGYAAIKAGYTDLGFMGGMAVPPVIRFGYGFVQGAEYAAQEMELETVNIRYHYTGNFDATPDNQSMAASWYNAGAEVIFAAGGSVNNSVMAAAENADRDVIGVDVDQSVESHTVVMSALKGITSSVYDGIAAYYAGTFRGGKTVTLDASVNGVGLPMDTMDLDGFTQEDYERIFNMIVDGSISILQHDGADDASQLPVEIVNVVLVD